jgi:hypothetical protein
MTELEMGTEQRLDVQHARLAALIEGDYDYQRLRRGQVCEATVLAVAGVLVQFGRIHGFVPNSHLLSIPRGLRGDRLRQAKSDVAPR